MHQLLPAQLVSTPYRERDSALSAWKIDLPVEISPPEASNRQKAWDEPKVAHLLDTLLAQCNDQVSRACLLAAGCSESGTWLNAPPVSSLGLRMSNDTVRIAIGLRVGASLCLAHECCSCGTPVDEFGRHGLSCRSSQGRSFRHQSLNNVIHHSLASANVPSRLEPSGLHMSDGKRPDGVSMVPWSSGRFLVWDATCMDTFCESHREESSLEAGGAAAHAERAKARKYAHLDHAYRFQPVAFETCGTIGPESLPFLRELGRRLRSATGEPNSYIYLIQRLSVAIQVGNSISVLGTLPNISNYFECM